MFSLDSFYNILYKNLILPINGMQFYFSPFGSISPYDLKISADHCEYKSCNILYYDQEPLYLKDINHVMDINITTDSQYGLDNLNYDWSMYLDQLHLSPHGYPVPNIILANSEISHEKNVILKYHHLQDWYYFFHGIAALDWFKNIRYIPSIIEFDKVFICFNNLFEGKRNYRLTLLANLIDRNISRFGHISINQNNTIDKIRKEVVSKNPLSVSARKLIFNTIKNVDDFVIDAPDVNGTFSAHDDINIFSKGLVHLVTETVFYDNKLHLTEKIFKPIVAKRPFMLVGAPGNLAYLRKYGFRTFGQWIDESYDNELNHDTRIQKIVLELEKLCNLSKNELISLQKEMQEITDYNFNWFYTGFKKLVIDELVDNFQKLVVLNNNTYHRDTWARIDKNLLDFDSIKKLLNQ